MHQKIQSRIYLLTEKLTEKMQKKYPIGIQNFEKLRRDGYFYVDKTEMLYRMVTDGQYYFLSRPRRFGKSLLVSTLEAYFEGKKDLFDGLAVSELEHEWKKYPVFHFDLSIGRTDVEGGIDQLLDRNLSELEKVYGKNDAEHSPEDRFSGLISRAAGQTGEPVVILIDEYDKPVLRAIRNSELRHENSLKLQSFFSVTKSQDRNIKFVLMTGLTRIQNESIFGGFNNFCNISDYSDYVDLCGLTETELYGNFEEDIKALADANGQTYGQACKILREMYGGYHFSERGPEVYNPSSVMTALSSMRYGEYWFETGTPSSLIDFLKNSDYDLTMIEKENIMIDSLYAQFSESNPLPLLYQSGYLTIKDYNQDFMIYTLGLPNKDVVDSYKEKLVPYVESLRKYL